MIFRKIKYYLGNVLRYFNIVYLRKMGVTIGKNCFISLGAWIDLRRGKIIIGNNCSITRKCTVLSHDATAGRINRGSSGEGITVIEDNVFVGMNSVILSNVKIGENSIVGAGTVVSKDVPANTIVVGNPMREIKRYDVKKDEWIPICEK